VGSPVADVVTGLYGAIAMLTGLVARSLNRPGRHFEAPLLESTMSALVNQAQGFLATASTPRDWATTTQYRALWTVTTSDGLLLLAVGTDQQFARLVKVLGDERLLRGGGRATTSVSPIATLFVGP